jgi:cation transport regulator ChaB
MPRNRLSERTKKAISHLSPKQKRTFRKAHASALKHYRSPSKRKGRSGSPEEAAHRVAWSAVKKSKGGRSKKKS